MVGGEISEIANISTEDIKTIVHEALNKTIKTSLKILILIDYLFTTN